MPIIGKPLLVLGSLAGVSLVGVGGFIGISALDSKSSQKPSESNVSTEDSPTSPSAQGDLETEVSRGLSRDDNDGSPQRNESQAGEQDSSTRLSTGLDNRGGNPSGDGTHSISSSEETQKNTLSSGQQVSTVSGRVEDSQRGVEPTADNSAKASQVRSESQDQLLSTAGESEDPKVSTSPTASVGGTSQNKDSLQVSGDGESGPEVQAS